MDVNDFIDANKAMVSRIAGQVAAGSPGIDAEDIAQEIWLDLLTENKWESLIDKDPNYTKRVMYRAGDTYAASERMSFIHHSAQWIYTPREVRALFEVFFLPEYWLKAPQKDDGDNINNKNVLCSLFDLKAAYEALSVTDQGLIRQAYGDDLPSSDASARKGLQRAIDRVATRLNGAMAAKSSIERIDIHESEDI